MRRDWIHISMAVLVFLSASGLLLREHYCQDIRQSASLYVAVATCHASTAAPEPACPMHPVEAPAPEDGCCSEKGEYLKLDQEQSFQVPLLSSVLALPAPLPLSRLLAGEALMAPIPGWLNHRPPLLRGDPHALLQIYRC